MALADFDADKHHVGLGLAGGTKKGFVLDGAYAKSLQREASVPGASEFGGTLDLIARADSPNLSRWTQDDFTGGAFSSRFDNDPAMFADSLGYLPGQQSRSLMTVPPVVLKAAFDPTAEDFASSHTSPEIPKAMFTVAGSVFVVFPHGILRYRQDNGDLQWGNWLIDDDHYYVDAAYDLNEQIIYVLLGTDLDTDSPMLVRLSPTLLDSTPYAIGSFDPAGPLPNTKGKVGKGMQIMGQNIVVGIGLRLYTCAPPEDVTDVLNLPTWTQIGRLPGYWIDSCAYNGMVYILCGAVDGKTQLVAFDGTAVLPICELPFNFRGHCVAQYGGRVYVGGSGTGLAAGDRFAELYEVTGASVRLVRTFSDQYRSWNVTNWPQNLWDLTVDEGLLWFSQKLKKLWAYDLTSDGFFGGSALDDSEDIVFFKHAVGKERLWLWGTHQTDVAQHGLYAIAEDSSELTDYSAQLVTSDFVIEPGLDKLWKKLVVMSKGQPVDTCEYSVDSGNTWVAFAAVGVDGDGTEPNYTTCTFPADTKSRHMRFRISQDCGTDAGGVESELVAYTASFEFVDPDYENSMKHGWTFVVAAVDAIEAFDGTTSSQSPGDFDALFTWAKDQSLLDFADLGGATYTVKIQAVTQQRPRIGPEATDGVPESYFSVTLLEATA